MACSVFSFSFALVLALVLCTCLPVDALHTRHRINTRAGGSSLADQVLANVDFSVDPCNDFYQFACGGWLKQFTLPSDRSRYSLSADTIGDANEQTLLSILDNEAGPWPVIGPFYASCTDTKTIDQRGAAPVQSLIRSLGNATSDATRIISLVGSVLHANRIDSLFSMSISANVLKPTNTQLQLDQGGLGLSTPADYQDQDMINAYQSHITNMFTLLGHVDGIPATSSLSPATQASYVISIEKMLASSSLSPEDRRDPYLLLHPTNVNTLISETASVGGRRFWDAYLTAISLPVSNSSLWSGNDTINVAVPPYFYDLIHFLEEVNSDSHKSDMLFTYLRWCILNSLANQLSDPFVTEHFNFYGKFLNGQQEMSPRWRQCIKATDANLGELLGRYYVALKFSAEAKSLANDMVNDIEKAFLSILPEVDWLDNQTRIASAKKLSLVSNQIGYPAHWTDYSSLLLLPTLYFENTLAARQLSFSNEMKSMFLPVDKNKWEMTTPEVNAYYDPTKNQMVFPAGILQSPYFFDLKYPTAMNFGGIGNVMGHELSHGFDDEGSQYDGTGKLSEWWPTSVRDAFDQRTQCVANLYDQFQVLPGVYINGNLTLGENVADMGGMHLSHVAYKQHVKRNGDEPQAVPPFTNEQLFFVTYALTWCEVDTPEYIRQMVQSNPHSPVIARVNVPLSQYAPFAQVFQCSPNSKMNPSKRCTVW